ncbi:putative ribonuclease H-like domain-containing protein, partial [Tanacetum coccineum]
EGEESEDQGRNQDIDDDPLASSVRKSMKEMSTDFVTPTKASGEAQEEEISLTILKAAKTLSKIDIGLDAKEEINTGIEKVSTGSTKVDSGTANKRGQRERKAPMIEEDIQASHKTKEQMRQEQARLEEAIKLQAQMDDEVAKHVHLDKMIAKRMAEEEALSKQQKKRKAQVQFEAQFYTEEDWDVIRAKLEANAELSKDVLGKDLPEQDFAKRMVDMVNQRKKYFAEERAKAKRNKSMTQSQVLVTKPHNKKDERGIVVRNKERMVAQGYTQEEGIDYDEVYVCQPPGFEDPQFPDNVYKVEKALYGLNQAPKAWYETLSTYLLENRFRRSTIDKTLFIKKDKGEILLVQVYVDDIIFGSTKKSLCVEFEQMMHKRFHMSSMRELTFLLGLQVKQKDDGIFISQDNYVADILKKFDFTTIKTARTSIETNNALLKDEEAEDVVKRIFRYLKGQPKLGLWYPRDSPFNYEAFSDSDYAGASLDRKSTTGVVANSTTEAEYVAAANCYGQVLWIQNQMLDYGFNFMNTKIYIDNEKMEDRMERATATASSLEAEFALSENPTIYDSYIKQFWQTATVNTLDNGEQEITATVDGHVKTVTIASVRKYLQLADAGGLSSLPNTKIFDQLSLMGETIRQEFEIPHSNFPTQTPVVDEAAFIGLQSSKDMQILLRDELTLAEHLMEIRKECLLKLMARLNMDESESPTEDEKRESRVAADEDFDQQLQAGESVVKEIFETTMRKVQSFVPMGSELEVQRLKRAGQEVLEEPKLVLDSPVEEVYVESLNGGVMRVLGVQFKYLNHRLVGYSEDTRRL